MPQRQAARWLFVLGAAAAIPLAFAATFNVTGNDTSAETLAPASGGTETGTVDAAGDLNISGSTVAVTITGGSGTRTANIDNSGKIRQVGSGRAIRNSSGAAVIGIENRAGATLSANGDDAIQVSVPASSVTVNNAGTISSGAARAFNARDAGSSSFNNLATGVARGTAADAVRPGTNGIVTNAGLIEALPNTTNSSGVIKADSDEGIKLDVVSTNNLPVTGVTVTNSGTIKGRHGITGGANANAAFNMSITNQVGGVIRGIDGSGVNIDSSGANRGDATVVNHGEIYGDFDHTIYNTGDGDGVDVDGLLTLTNNGIIRGRGAGGLGTDGGASNPEGVSVGGGTIINNAGAEITGQDTTGTGTKGHGILSDDSSGGAAPGVTSITNAGLIRGYDSYGIRMIGNRADSITNSAGGTIRGGGNAAQGAAIQMGDGADTLSNSGSITGDSGLAVDLEAGDDTMHVLGGAASISGDVSGGAGSNALDFDLGTPGSLSYTGVLSNFATVELKSGSLTLSGANTYAGNTTITAGSLVVANASGKATGAGTVTVKNGARLAGDGAVGNTVAEAGAILAPAGSLGIDGDLAVAAGARLQVGLGAVADQLNVSGTLNFSGSGTLIVDISDNGIVAGTDYTLASFGSASGFSAANVALGSVPGGLEASLEVTANSIVLRTSTDIDVSPGSLVFGDTVVDQDSAVQSVTITNDGAVPLHVGTPTLSGAQQADFSIASNACGSAVAPDDSCTIGIRFRPSATGSRVASLNIPSNAAGSPATVSLSGSGVAAHYSLQASPASLGFGNQPVGSTSGAQNVMLTNDGNMPITVSGFSAGGSHPADFAIGTDLCSGQNLAVGASCTVSFTFSPAAAGGRGATETVSSSPAQTGGSASFALSGTGTQASVGFSPASLSFGNQPVSSSSLPQPLVLTNEGDATLSIISISSTGDFSASHNCGAVLAPDASCQIDVTFSPTASGNRSGTVSLVSNASGSPHQASLAGTGTQAGLGVSGQTAFNPRTVGTPTAAQNITVTNTGTATLYVGSPSLGGSHRGDFSISGNGCGSGIAPAASCTIGVVFTPSATGARSASLSIPSNAPGSPASLPLSGTGLSGGAKPGKLLLSAERVSAKEALGSVVFRVSRTAGVDGAVSVHYATANGSALAGDDYVATSGTLTWEAGDKTPREITVTLVNDLLVEEPETFTMNLSSPTGGAVLGRALSTARIVSDDKPGALSFVGSSITVNENAGTATVTLRRTGGNGNAVGIHYATENGTALAGSDYTATSGDLGWAAGDVANKSFTIPLNWDTAAEKAEKFYVVLSVPTGGAKLGSPKKLTVTIGNVNH